MKRTLFISFDLIRPNEVKQPLALASILGYLRNEDSLKNTMNFEHISINMFTYGGQATPSDFEKYFSALDLENFNFIAISAYIWNEYLLNDFIKYLRIRGFRGKVILGGYQVTYTDSKDLPAQYPDVQIFISGYAEESLRKLFSSKQAIDTPVFLNDSIDFAQIPSVYLNSEIIVPDGTSMLRMETKRGCPYRCSFCAHRDLTHNRVKKHPLEKVFGEISFIKEKQVKRVNILDPVFNAGKEYLEIMREINRNDKGTTFTLQSRFENIKGAEGKQFLDECETGNFHLEFGLQTINNLEAKNINRRNNLQHIYEVLSQLNERNINYEVSLIYGLPGQTIDSFKHSINFVQSSGCKVIKAYPLMLLRGTELYHEKQKWNIQEETLGEFNIPVVTSSNSFTREEWEQMNAIANTLTQHERH